MKGLVLAAACCLAATLTVSAYAAPAGGAPPCVPKLQKVHGQPVVYECGSATATLRAGGHSYTFRNGLCQQSKAAGLALQLDLGILAATVKGNAGKPYLSIAIDKAGGGTVNAYQGGKLIANNLVSFAGHFPIQGTFKANGGGGAGANFSGSWNCHGTPWQAP